MTSALIKCLCLSVIGSESDTISHYVLAVSNTAYSTLIVYKLNLKVLVMVRCVDSIYLCLREIVSFKYKEKSQAKSIYED